MTLGKWSVLVVLVGGLFSEVLARTITIAQTGTADTQFIEEAIAAASAGDTIRVAAGFYTDPGLRIDKSLTLIGAGPDRTIFRYGWPNGIFIAADQVTIEGFTFDYDRGGWSAAAQSSGMAVEDHSPLIRGNRFIGGFAALDLFGDAQPIIQYNEFLTKVGIRLRNNPHPIDARFNWWDTDDRIAIQEKIWDGADEDGLGRVEFAPWLREPGGPLSTAIRPSGWGTLKRMQLLQGGVDHDAW